MPIHDLGYRSWQGRLCSQLTRWWVITETGVRLAWKSRLLRRFVFVAWLPALYMGIAFFLFEQSASSPDMRRAALDFFEEFAGAQGAAVYSTAIDADPALARHQVWAWLLHIFFRHPQGVLMVLVVGLVAPPLVSQDIRSRAFLLYFSRPITRAEYILGKMVTVCAYVAMITTLPALALYLFGVLLSPDLAVVAATWDLPFRILGASLVLMVPTTAIALAFSSLTTRSYYAGFAWFALWAFGLITYVSVFGALNERFDAQKWSLVSLHHTLGEVQLWLFNYDRSFADVIPSLVSLVGLSVVSIAVVFQRVSSCMRV